MVLVAFDLLVLTGTVLFGFLNIPSFQLLQSSVGEIFYFILISISLCSAHFLEKKFSISITVFTIFIGIVFGGIYLGILTTVIIFPLFFIIRWFTGAPDYEEAEKIKPLKGDYTHFYPSIYQSLPSKKIYEKPRTSITEKYSFFKKPQEKDEKIGKNAI